jgi:hypothetical protein
MGFIPLQNSLIVRRLDSEHVLQGALIFLLYTLRIPSQSFYKIPTV